MIEEALANAGLTIDDVDHLLLHQANIRIMEIVAKRLGISMDKVIRNLPCVCVGLGMGVCACASCACTSAGVCMSLCACGLMSYVTLEPLSMIETGLGFWMVAGGPAGGWLVILSFFRATTHRVW